MKDKFLYRFRKAPSREFTEALYRQISEKEGKSLMMLPLKRQPLVLTAVVLLAIVAMFAIFPTARAAGILVVQKIGDILFYQVEDFKDLGPVQEGEIVTVEAENIPLSAAREQFGFEFLLPTRIPEGFTQVGGAQLLPFADDTKILFLQWKANAAPKAPGILLTISPVNNFEGQVVVSGSSQEVQLDGADALLVRGDWDKNSGEWQYNGALSLQWSQDGLFYRLYAPFGGISEAALIDMAKSMK